MVVVIAEGVAIVVDDDGSGGAGGVVVVIVVEPLEEQQKRLRMGNNFSLKSVSLGLGLMCFSCFSNSGSNSLWMGKTLTSASGTGKQLIAEEANIAVTYCMFFLLLAASSFVEVGEEQGEDVKETGVDEGEQFFIFNIQLF